MNKTAIEIIQYYNNHMYLFVTKRCADTSEKVCCGKTMKIAMMNEQCAGSKKKSKTI